MHLALLGCLSLLQIVFLPGYLLLRSLRIDGGPIATVLISFALSLLANFIIVAALVVLGSYRPAVMYTLFAIEATLWLMLDAHRLGARVSDVSANVLRASRDFFRDMEHNCPIQSRGLRRTLIAAALALIVGFALAGLAEAGRIFEQWDAVVSWNRWATEWAANRLPLAASYYPQLLPANVSLTYVFMHTSEVWFFAKAIQFLFCLMLLLAMFDAARRPGNFCLVPGVLITYALFVALLRYRMLSCGYADMPLAFFAWMPVSALILAGQKYVRLSSLTERPGQARKPDVHALRWLFLGGLLAAGAALTKQLGLYVAAIYPLLAWLNLGQGDRENPDRLKPPTFRVLLYLYVMMGVLVAPWYDYKFCDIQADRDANNTGQLLSDYHEGRGIGERTVHAGAAVLEATTVPGGVLLVMALIASLRDRRSRWLLAIIVAPLGLLWAAGFSYDLRNLAMLVPFVGMAAGEGFARIVCAVEKRMAGTRMISPSVNEDSGRTLAYTSRLRFAIAGRLRIGYILVPLAVLLVAGLLCVTDQSILASQRNQQRRVGILSLNAQLYSIAAAHRDGTLIATDYQAIRWLPELAPRSLVCTCHELAAFRRTFDLQSVRYILVRTAGEAAEVREFLGREAPVRLLFEDHGFAFYEKLRPSA